MGLLFLEIYFSLKISVNRKVKHITQTVAKRVYTRTWKYNNASKKKERRRKKPKKPPSNETNKHTQQHMCTLSQCLMIYVYITHTFIHSLISRLLLLGDITYVNILIGIYMYVINSIIQLTYTLIKVPV